jgi:hypothetical protein
MAFVSIVDSATNRMIGAVPDMALPAGPGGISALELPAGSVWLAALLFDSAAPSGSWAGVRIRGGALRLSVPAAVSGTALQVSPGTVITLHLKLDRGAAASASGAHGGDARDLKVETPDEATFLAHVGSGVKLTEAREGALEVYGARLRLRHQEGAQARFEAQAQRLCFPFSVDDDRLSIAESQSELFRPRGRAEIASAAWAVPVASTPAEAQHAGGFVLAIQKGLTAEFASSTARLDGLLLVAEPAHLSLFAGATQARVRQMLELWGTASRLELRSREALEFRLEALASGNTSEGLVVQELECAAQLDRPLTAASKRVPFFSTRASLLLLRMNGETRITLRALADPPRDAVTGQQTASRELSFALTNALVRTSAATELRLGGYLDGQLRVERGGVQLQFATRFLMPTLPDPYAANIGRQPPASRRGQDRNLGLAARVNWTAADVSVSFQLDTASPALAGSFLPLEEAPIEPPSRNPEAHHNPEALRALESRFAAVSGQEPEMFRLLDVSSRADLFGVGYSRTRDDEAVGSSGSMALSGLDLIAPVRNVSAFTLPAFQWEPVYNIPNADAAPFPPKLISATDGGAARFAIPSAKLVPVAPLPVVKALLDEYGRDRAAALVARFTLPFGMVAVAEMRVIDDPQLFNVGSPHFSQIQPGFPEEGLVGGTQLSLEAPAHLIQPLDAPPALPGATLQTNNANGGYNVLQSGSIDATFNATFAGAAKKVPVQRIDFTGQGASTFSDWRRTGPSATGVTQVKLEAVVGRTSREVVQVRSRLYPWGAMVVRIITIERTGSGGVFRRDSGWQATSSAEYILPGCKVHSGVVPRLTNIRRIRDTTSVYEKNYGAAGGNVKLVQVLFDADVEVESVTLGANLSKRVPVRDIVGYVQTEPIASNGDIIPLKPDQLDELIATTGPIGGPIDCELNVAESGLHMRLARFEVDRTATLGGSPECVAVARGAADLADAGEWSFTYRGRGEQESHQLDPNRPLPLIRVNPSAGVTPAYRFADASQLHRTANPDTEYGLLLSTSSQRLLLPQPQLRWGESTIHAGSTPLFADMYSLAGQVALFPRADQCHPLPAGSALRITGRRKVRLDVAPQPSLAPGEFKVGVLERTLSESAALRVKSRFRPDSTIRLKVDSDQHPNWSCSYGPVSFVNDVDNLSDLMMVEGRLESSATEAPQLRHSQMIFGGPLGPIQGIIDLLTSFGLPLPFDVAVTNPKYTFKSGAKFQFPLPGPEGAIHKWIEHGLGVALELELLAGFGKESENAGVAAQGAISDNGIWHSYLEAEAKITCKTISLAELITLYLGGAFKFEIEGQSHGKSEVTMYYGAAGTVKVGVTSILEISGGRTYSLVSRYMVGEPKVGAGLSSEYEVEGELLFGLAAVKLSFELMVLFERTDNFHLTGEATLAIDVTLGWVFNKSFEVEFEMSETVAAIAFIATTVLPVR